MYSFIGRLNCCSLPNQFAIEPLDNWTVEDLRLWKQDFKAMLKNPKGFALFKKFAKTEDSEENPSFWKACEDLQKLKKEEEIAAKCQEVYEEYIHKLNLKSGTKEAIIAAKDNLRPETFLAAQEKIFDLMKIDSWPRFKTDYLKKVCKARGIEWPSTPQVPQAAEEAVPEADFWEDIELFKTITVRQQMKSFAVHLY